MNEFGWRAVQAAAADARQRFRSYGEPLSIPSNATMFAQMNFYQSPKCHQPLFVSGFSLLR
nr:hypothetical protein TQ38_28515 [Novosphingobium sp. P6W]